MASCDYSKIIYNVTKDMIYKTNINPRDKKKCDANSFIDFFMFYSNDKANTVKQTNSVKKNLAVNKSIKAYKRKLIKGSFKRNKNVWYRYLFQGGCIRMFLMEGCKKGPCIRTVSVEDASISLMSKVENKSTEYMLRFREEWEGKRKNKT